MCPPIGGGHLWQSMTQSCRVISRSRDGRRRYDEKGKRALVEAALRPGMSVARLAQEHGVNANLLRKWITKYLLERESSRCAQAAQDGAVVVDSGGAAQVSDRRAGRDAG